MLQLRISGFQLYAETISQQPNYWFGLLLQHSPQQNRAPTAIRLHYRSIWGDRQERIMSVLLNLNCKSLIQPHYAKTLQTKNGSQPNFTNTVRRQYAIRHFKLTDLITGLVWCLSNSWESILDKYFCLKWMACSIIVKQTLGHTSEHNQNGCAGGFNLYTNIFPIF